MPRTGGIYYLPSPPSPYQPNTLAAAEDVNTSLNDIATALTGSLPTDGSAAMTGSLNMNGQAITGASSIGASGALTVGALTASSLNVTGAASLGSLYTPSANIVSLSQSMNANGQSITGAYDLTATNLVYSNGDVDAAGNVNVSGNVSCAGEGGFQGIVFMGELSCSGPGYVNGLFTCENSAQINGTLTMAGSDIFMNGHWLRDVGNILAPGGGTLTIGNSLFVAGPVQAPAGLQTSQINTSNGGGMSWWFGENGGYGVATSSSGGVYIWTPFLREVVDQLPRSLTRDVGAGVRAVDTNACLVTIFDELRTLSDRLEALEALVPA